MIQKKLSDKKKIKVLEELQAGVFDIPSASKKYKISKQSLYTWLKTAGISIPPS